MYDLEKRFCKDNKLPIKVFTEGVFEERLKLFNAFESYQDYISMIQNYFDSPQAYLSYYNQVKDKAIEYIKNSEAYIGLNSCDMSVYHSEKINIPKRDVYKSMNIGHNFIGLDMKMANFSALVYYGIENSLEFFDTYNYDVFIDHFTSISHIKQSKYIRQVIFGNCNPKRQISYESYLMSKLLSKLISSRYVLEEDIYSLLSDEIIIRCDNMSDKSISFLENFITDFSAENFPIKFEKYRLGKVEGTEAYIKEFDGGNYDLKCVNPIEAPFIYRYIKCEAYQDTDFIFDYEGRPAKLLEAPNLSISFDYKEE